MLAQELFGHRVIELQKELILTGDFGKEILSSKLHGCIELCFVKTVEAFDTEILPVRGPANGSFMAGDPALAAFDDPFEHSEVLSETGPQELALRIFPEPVDMEDPRESPNVPSHVEPVCKIV